jgi:hypothetical protein
MELAHYSAPMRWLNALGLRRLAWSLRRLHCPVPASALVLEVGSGGNPYPRANVLVDAYEETRERHWDPLVHDRPTVLANGEKLPFADKTFDFVIAAHVLEHTAEPEKFLGELQRVAHAGYIETPDAFMERINPYKDHRLEVTVRNGRLVLRKKSGWLGDPELVELYEAKAKPDVTRDLIPRHPENFHVRFYWSDTIPFEIVNPATDASWTPEPSAGPPAASGLRKIRASARQAWLSLLRSLFSQRRRNGGLDIVPLLSCPACGSNHLDRSSDTVICGSCGTHYPYQNGVLTMNSAGPPHAP